jgi:hypothetical protein
MSDTSTTDLIARLRREAEGLLPAWRHKRRLINDAAARIEALEQQVAKLEAAGCLELMRKAIETYGGKFNAQGERRWRHLKRGSSYIEIGRAELQASAAVQEGAQLVVYQSEHNSKIWVRPKEEFEDGRFMELERQPVEPFASQLTAARHAGWVEGMENAAKVIAPKGERPENPGLAEMWETRSHAVIAIYTAIAERKPDNGCQTASQSSQESSTDTKTASDLLSDGQHD